MRIFRLNRAHLEPPCWCGAAPGKPCRDSLGRVTARHATRGTLDRATVDAISRAAGLPSLSGELDELQKRQRDGDR